jgi:hypothetical protein
MFDALEKAQGPEAAFAWLKKLVPPERRNPLCVKAFYTRRYELLWSFIEEPAPNDHPDTVWLVRAAAAAVNADARAKHGEALRRHYEAQSADPYFRIARYLVGLAGEPEVLPLATTNELRCAVAFYAGVKAEGEGRYSDASDWYRVAVETEAGHEIGQHLALRTLLRWRDAGKPLETLAAKRL